MIIDPDDTIPAPPPRDDEEMFEPNAPERVVSKRPPRHRQRGWLGHERTKRRIRKKIEARAHRDFRRRVLAARGDHRRILADRLIAERCRVVRRLSPPSCSPLDFVELPPWPHGSADDTDQFPVVFELDQDPDD